MSSSRTGSDRQPLLPAEIEHSLSDLAIRLCGGALVAFPVTSWLALLSWRIGEAGGEAAARASRNLLGSFGAALSDMMVQTVGMAVVFALIVPLVWGMELLAGVRWLPRFRIKAVLYILGLVLLSAMASGLPQPPGWPLLGGAGGMLGDLLFNLLSTASLGVGMTRGGWLLPLILAAAGMSCLAGALGISMRSRAARKPTVSAEEETAGIDHSIELPDRMDDRAFAPGDAEPLPQPQRVTRHLEEGEHVTQEDAAQDAEAARFAERFAPVSGMAASSARQRLAPALRAFTREKTPAAWRKPSLNLLRRSAPAARGGLVDVASGANRLIDVLSAFGVKGEIRDAATGPVVTRYELEPARGTKISRVIGLADDFARELGVHAIRVSVTPGRTTIGIEVPNETRQSVGLRDILENDAFQSSPAVLPLAAGKGIAGEPVVLDLARMPHLLIAGTTGSGKSVGLNAMLVSLLYRLDPTELRLLLIDPKMLEMAQYDRIPHLLNPVITDPQEAALALEWAVAEMERRYKRMALAGCRNIEGYNGRVRSARERGQPLTRTVQTGFDPATGRPTYEVQALECETLPYIVIVIDELADLMLSAGKRVDGSLQRLAQKARAAGIHLVMATQRPSVDVVTGTIKANFPVRISFRVASRIDSRTIINDAGAEQLLGQGDMLLTTGSGQHARVHGAFVADDEIERVVEALRDQGGPQYVELAPQPDDGEDEAPAARTRMRRAAPKSARCEPEAPSRDDEIFRIAVATTLADRKASEGHLQRRLGLSPEEAAYAIARMEHEGVVGARNLFGRRAILIEEEGHEPLRRHAA